MAEEKEEEKGSLGETAGQEAGQRIGKNLGSKIGAGTASEGAGAAGTGAGAAGAEGVAAGAAGTAGGTAAGTAAGTAGGTAAGVGAGAAAGGATAGATAGSVVPGIGTAIGAALGTAVGAVVGKSIKWIILGIVGVAGGVIVFFLLFLVIIIAGIVGVIGGFDPSTGLALGSQAQSQTLSITKTAKAAVTNSNHIDKGSTDGNVTYTFNITNSGTDTIKDVKVNDAFSGTYSADKSQVDGEDHCNFDVGDIDSGKTVTKTCQINIKKLDDDWVLSNIATVSGTQGGSTTTTPGGAKFQGDQIGCLTIKWENGKSGELWNEGRETVLRNAISTAASYPAWLKYLCDASGGTVTLRLENYNGGINADEYGGTTLNIYANPFLTPARTERGRAFVMAHELTHIIQTYDVDGVYKNFMKSSAHDELVARDAVIRSYPICTGKSIKQDTSGNYIDSCWSDNKIDPYHEDFAEMAGNFVALRDGYPISFQTEYPEHYKFAQNSLYASSGSSSVQILTASTTAIVIIGKPPATDPVGWPVSGTITQLPYCSPAGTNDCTNYHSTTASIDIGAIEGTNVYATHSGIVQWGNAELRDYNGNGWFKTTDANGKITIDSGDLAVCQTKGPYGCMGIYVIITGLNYKTIYMHLESVNFACVPLAGSGQIMVGALIGKVDDTGNSYGNHLHYEARLNNGTPVPKADLGSVFPNYNVSSVQTSYSGTGCGQ